MRTDDAGQYRFMVRRCPWATRAIDRPGPLALFMHPSRAMFAARLILFGVVLAQLVDALTFTIGVSRYGIGLESNALAATLYAAAGLAGVLGAKAAALLITLAILVTSAHRFPRVLVWGGATATAFGLLGFATNSVSLAILG